MDHEAAPHESPAAPTAALPQAVTPPPPQPPPPAPPAPAVDTDTLCYVCGYNLKGLAADGRCPECAAPIRDTLEHRERLVFSDPGYLARLVWGARVMLMVMSVDLFFYAAIWLAPLLALQASPVALQELYMWVEYVSVYSAIPLALVGLWGQWLLTTRDERVDSGAISSRRALRWLAVSTASLETTHRIIWWGALSWSPSRLSQTGGRSALTEVLQLLQWPTSAALFVVTMMYLRWLFGRLPDPRLRRRVVWCAGFIAVAYLSMFAPFAMVLSLGIFMLLGPLVASLLYIWLFVSLHNRVNAIRWQRAAPTGA